MHEPTLTHALSLPSYLHLYDPLSHPAKPKGPRMLSLSTPLSEFFREFVLPNFLLPTRAAKRNIVQYEESLRLWVQYTGDPPLGEITQTTCSRFLAGLAERRWNDKPLAQNTIRKHCTPLQKMIDLAGPRTRRNRTAAGLLSGEPPYLERPPRQIRPVRDDFSLSEIGAIQTACEVALGTTNLSGIPAPLWWRALFVFLPNTGTRIGTALAATWDMFDRDYPGWLNIPPSAYKGGRQGGYFYVNSHARTAIEPLRDFSNVVRSPLIFPWLNWPESANWLQECRRRIMAASGIPEHRQFGFHGCRKFLGTWVAPQNGLLASIILGHKSANVTRDSYVNPKVVEELLERVPQPSFLN